MYLDKLTESQREQIRELVWMADEEFVPALSARYSTTQKDLPSLEVEKNRGPQNYFEEMIQQSFLVHVEAGKIVGFISYIPQYLLRIPGDEKGYMVQYISTIIVHPKYRNKGITEKMYTEMQHMATLPLATRTWSTNYVHIRILNKLQFEVIATIENDRGNNIDTVYFMKKKK